MLIEQQSRRAVELRHRLHQIPELGYEEFKTAAAIRAELDTLGIEHVDGVPDAPTATIAMIGDLSKPCIALRSDIDALPIEERTGLPYASQHHGQMHACGHDGHIATLMGTAAVLKSMAAKLPVCIKLLWQPAEEGGGGAERLIAAGALDGRIGPKVRAIFGLHGWPGLKVGTVASKAGVLLAATDSFEATFTGRGCHGAFPHMGIDPIVTAAEAVVNLQQFVSREFDPTDSAVVTIGEFHAGTATNIIPDTAWIAGTARTLNEPAQADCRGDRATLSGDRRCRAVPVAVRMDDRISADGERSGDVGLRRQDRARGDGPGPVFQRSPAVNGRRGLCLLPGKGSRLFFPDRRGAAGEQNLSAVTQRSLRFH